MKLSLEATETVKALARTLPAMVGEHAIEQLEHGVLCCIADDPGGPEYVNDTSKDQ
jgi:hypothetical protein